MDKEMVAKLEPMWCREALQVQDACNISGVVLSFSKMLMEMTTAGLAEMRREHPATVLFLDKINDLCNRPDLGAYSKAYDYCKRRSA